VASIGRWLRRTLDRLIGFADEPTDDDDVRLRKRVGVIAGYLWGDTVNTASRMQSSGVPGRIQVSLATWQLVRGGHDWEPRTVEIKGLGRMETHLLVR
jgi:class 3 adenylate cyclase